LQPLDQIVLVAVTSAHRGESFQARVNLRDGLSAPSAVLESGTDAGFRARWVDASVGG
jgi:molybdopterin synthase catalytic subunit